MKHLYLDAGAFRDWLTLQENNQVEDGYGGFVNSWSTVSQSWARIMPAQTGFPFALRLMKLITPILLIFGDRP